MSTYAMGPTFDGGEEVVGVGSGGERYELLFLPDVNNDDLQAEGKPPVYYWVPRVVRIARRGEGGEGGQFKFRLLHFVGVQSGDTHVGVDGTRETAGGVLSVTTTTAPPVSVYESAKQELIRRVTGDTRRFWGLRSNLTPHFAPTPVTASRVAMTNLSPGFDGTVPIEMPTDTGGTPAGGTGNGATPAPAEGGAPPGPRLETIRRRSRGDLVSSPRGLRLTRDLRYERDVGGSALDPWYWGLQGQGPGPIDPGAEHAFSGLLGTLPTAILYTGFHGSYSPVSVVQSFLLPLWTTNIRLKIRGNWRRIFDHFSAAAKGRYWWFSADIKAEFNALRISGGIEVELLIDGTAPGADKIEEEINKRIDAIVGRFTELAKQVIFVPAPTVEPAQATEGGGLLSGLFGYGGGVALKWRHDQTDLNLSYDETRKFRYNRLHVVSSSLEGFYEEIKRDPEAEQKYFATLFLDDWDRKVTRIFKPVVNWPDPSQKWVGDPVAFLSCQVGYPDTSGAIQWAAHVFQSTDTGDTTTWTPAMARKGEDQVVNAPEGWAPDRTFVKRTVHFTEPPGALESPNNRVFVERNTIELDPGENGTLTSDNTLDVRSDSIGTLEVGPISLNVALEDRTQVVEVEFQANGKTLDGQDRPIVRFTWSHSDQDDPRRWKIFTGDPNFLPDFKYRVRVIVKGSIFAKGMEWVGPWQNGAGNGPLTVSVPTPDDEGVTRRSLDMEDEPASSGAITAPPGTSAPTRPVTPPVPIAAPPGGRMVEPEPAMIEGYSLVPERETTRSSSAAVPPPPSRRGERSTTPKRRAGEVIDLTPKTKRSPAPGLELVGGWSRRPRG